MAATCLKVLCQHLPLSIQDNLWVSSKGRLFIVPVFEVGTSRSCIRYAKALNHSVLILAGKLTNSPCNVQLRSLLNID